MTGISTTSDERQWVLWAGTVGFDSDLRQRFDAAADNGYSHVSLGARDVARAAANGVTGREIRQRATDAGLSLILDPLMNWHPVTASTRPSRSAQFSRDDNLRAAEALGAVSINAIAMETSDPSPTQFVEPFAELCDLASDCGALVHLEFIPMTPISDVATAWRIVDEAGRANAGILVDSWHFFRGSARLDDLEAVPGERIFAVQLDDALLQPGTELWHDTQHRLLPGDGQLDLDALVAVLSRNNALRLLGPEVISPEMAQMTPNDAAGITRRSIEALLARHIPST